jgi:hypothetical protein
VAMGQLEPGGSAAGAWMYLNNAQRYIYGHFPKGKPKFFDASLAVPSFDAVPASEPKQPIYPCEVCPSTGADSPTPATTEPPATPREVHCESLCSTHGATGDKGRG